MPDPFRALRAPIVPMDPDPGFAARLRDRLEERLASSAGGMTVSVSVSTRPATVEPAATPTEPGIVPYLIVRDARQALDWYSEVLGAVRRGDPYVMADGRIGHAELDLSGGRIYVADESPASNVGAPLPGEPARVTIVALVADVDAAVERSVAAGATVERPAADNPYGRNAVIRDPFGHRWMLSAPPPAATASRTDGAGDRLREGDIGYVSLQVPDVERAADFFAGVLGWTYGPGSGPQGRQVAGITPSHGLWGGQARSTLLLCFVVDDVDAALERVRAAGGSAEAPTDEPYGRLANCVDDQGTAFAMYTPPAGGAHAGQGRRSEVENGARQGDLGYVTMHVVDSTRARAFYGAVLGWRFTPGQAEDGWSVDGVVPMTGMHGGNADATVVPMYRVDDIAAALERVRVRGGTAPEAERRPYGLQALCEDDQGTRFYLWQP